MLAALVTKFKPYLAPVLVGLALLLVGVVGHRHWLPTHTPPVVIEQAPPTAEAPAVEQPKPTVKRKPVKKPKKPTPKKTEPKKTPPVVVPRPTPYRECDENGWCWTYF